MSRSGQLQSRGEGDGYGTVVPYADDQLEGTMPEFNSGGSTSSGPAGMGTRSAQYTGSYIVLLDPRNQKAGLTALPSGAGLGEAQSASAFDVAGTAEALASDESVVFEEIGVAVVGAEPDQRQALART